MGEARYEAIIIGAGIAGASAAFFLAPTRRVLILEREAQPGFHATGRSGAIFVQSYGNPVVRALNRITRPFLEHPPSGFSEAPLVGPACGVLTIATPLEAEALDELDSRPDRSPLQRRVSPEEAAAIVPILRRERIVGGLFDPDACAIDVDALLQGFLRGARREGAELMTSAEVRGLSRTDGEWRVVTEDAEFSAPVVVNAAGAWAGTVGALAAASAVPLQPLRRTGVLVDPPPGVEVTGWPLVLDARETFYFKPDAGKLMLSPADETPSAPMDAFAEEFDVALAVDRVQAVADLPVRRVNHAWAGLRTFAADRTPVAGFDPRAEGFFWLAGQGGYGLQTSAAMGRLAAALVRGEGAPADFTAAGVSAASLSPERFG